MPAFEKFLGVFKHGGVGLVVRRGKIENRFAQDATHSCGLGFFGQGVFEIIHIGESGDPASNLLGGGKACAPADKIFRDVSGFRRKDVFAEPLVQSDVVT